MRVQVEQDTVVEYRYLVRDIKAGRVITESTIFRRLCLVCPLIPLCIPSRADVI